MCLRCLGLNHLPQRVDQERSAIIKTADQDHIKRSLLKSKLSDHTHCQAAESFTSAIDQISGDFIPGISQLENSRGKRRIHVVTESAQPFDQVIQVTCLYQLKHDL